MASNTFFTNLELIPQSAPCAPRLSKRMRVCREIGTFKKEHAMTILQTGRYNEILDKRGAQGALCGMSSEFVKKVFEAIHEESVRQQMEIINK